MRHTVVDSLIDLLDQEEAIYAELGRLLEEEHELIPALALSRIEELSARKETLALRIKAMDESRKMLARRVASIFGIKSDEATLGVLCGLVESDQRTQLQLIGDRLRKTLTRCQELNELNGRAIGAGAKLASSAIEYLIEQADPSGKIYKNPTSKRTYTGVRPGVAAGLIHSQA